MKYLIFSFFILFAACASETNADHANADVAEEGPAQTEAINSENLTLAVLQEQPWEIEIVLDNGNITDKNQWKSSILNFSADGSYTWKGKSIDNSGKYELDQGENIILLDAANSENSSEWSIKHRRSMMVWVGTPKFGHHALQMKLNKQSTLDRKSE